MFLFDFKYYYLLKGIYLRKIKKKKNNSLNKRKSYIYKYYFIVPFES